MAKETVAENKKVVFYAYEYVDGTLRLKKRWPLITWKYGKGYRDPLTQQIMYEDEDLDIRFVDGIFETSHPDQIAYLELYNKGGRFKLSSGREVPVSPDPQMSVTISKEDLLVRQVVKTETVTKTINTLPKSALHLFDVQALKDFCISESITMPAEVTLDGLIDVLTQEGRIV